MSLSKEKINNALDTISVLWIILSTGSLFLCIFNMKLTMFVLLGLALCYVMRNKKMGGKQFRTIGAILLLVVLNALINIQYFELTDDIIILLIRLFSLGIICTYVTRQCFMEKFCKIVFVLCLLSLICFAASEAGLRLPGETTLWFKNKYYIYTFYHTIGRWRAFHRNAGIFWESPAFAIFINIAISFLMLGDVKITPKRRIVYFVVYSITLFSTLAITAYIAFFLVLIAILFQRRKQNKEKRGADSKSTRYLIGMIVLAVLIVFLVQENNTHMIYDKIFNRQGSYFERSNDAMQAIYLTLNRPLAGYGLFNKYTYGALTEVAVNDNSNSFTSMAMYLGLPLFAVYVWRFVWGLRQFFKGSLVSFLLVAAAFILFLNTEQIALMTLFLFFLFPVKEEKDAADKSNAMHTNLDLENRRGIDVQV